MTEIIRGASKIDTDHAYNNWNADGGYSAQALYREASCKDKAFGETRYTIGSLNTG